MVATAIRNRPPRAHDDIDAVILMATMLASKRRPAELVEIVAAADLIQGSIPFVESFGNAMARLSTRGLIGAVDSGLVLTAAGMDIMARQPRKAAMDELVSILRFELAVYRPKEDGPALALSGKAISTAVLAHKASRNAAGKNLLMPKAKPNRHFKVEGRWRRASSTR